MFGTYRRLNLSLFTIGLCAVFASVTSTHIGLFDFGDGGTVCLLSKETIFYGGIGLGVGLMAMGTLLRDFDLGVFRDHRMPRLDGLASYIVLAFALTLTFGLLYGNIISASLFASGVSFLALLGIVALVNTIGLGGTGHRAQWRQGIGSAA